jgi:hypothetical protein
MSRKAIDPTKAKAPKKAPRRLAQKGIGPAGLLDLTAFLTFDFTDEQWNQLVHWSGNLPQTAREEFKNCVRGYLFNKARPAARAEDRERNKRLREKILDLLNDSEWKPAIASLEGLDMYYESGGRLRPPPPVAQLLDKLLKLLAKKLEFRNLDVSQSKLDPGPKSSRASYQFIADAAALLEKFTHKRATRSEKKGNSNFRAFITELSKIADPAITSGTIDEALKKYITRSRGEDRSSFI